MAEHVFFDLNGTLFDASVMAEPVGAGPDFVDAILGDAVVLAMVATITEFPTEFAKLVEAAARRQLEIIGKGERLSEVVAAAGRMRPFPDAAEAIGTLRAAGFGVGVLTNSSTATAEALIAATDLELDPIIGTDQVRAFKPDRRVYERALEVVGSTAAETFLISAHWWDAIGAKRAGLRTGWISREEALRPAIGPAPDHEAEDLATIAGAIVQR